MHLFFFFTLIFEFDHDFDILFCIYLNLKKRDILTFNAWFRFVQRCYFNAVYCVRTVKWGCHVLWIYFQFYHSIGKLFPLASEPMGGGGIRGLTPHFFSKLNMTITIILFLKKDF